MNIRWMTRKDFPAVLRIESESFEFPWTDDDLIMCLRDRTSIGVVAEEKGQVIGYMVYVFANKRYDILNMAVSHEYRFQGVASDLIERLKSRLNFSAHRKSIQARTRERNIAVQKLFRKCGFKAMSMCEPQHDSPIDEMDYLFEYRLNSEAAKTTK